MDIEQFSIPHQCCTTM